MPHNFVSFHRSGSVPEYLESIGFTKDQQQTLKQNVQLKTQEVNQKTEKETKVAKQIKHGECQQKDNINAAEKED